MSSRALVELNLLDEAGLRVFTDDPPAGVLGLSSALAKAGKVTAYQAAALYQKKGRDQLVGN
jgi:hypothetical protein